MTRKALIITNPGEANDPEHYCEDVFIDVTNYEQYLRSPLGGAWESYEIDKLNRPTCSEVKMKIAGMSSTDYTMVIFCGHGGIDGRSGNTILELKQKEYLDSLDLRTGSKKRTILLDCCRKVVPRELLEKAELRAAYAFAEPELNRQACRRAFDEQIMRCSNGVIVGYGCSPDQVAAGHPTKGGYYSSSLIGAAFSWFEGKKGGWRIVPEQRSIVSIQADAVPRVTRLSGGTQTPMMEKPRTEPYFPFAVVA